MTENKKILVVTPSLPFPESGAEQQDRAAGIRQLKRLGFEVQIICKIADGVQKSFIEEKQKELGVIIHGIPYLYSNRKFSHKNKIFNTITRILSFYRDGASREYSEPVIRAKLVDVMKGWKPDLVFFDYSYLWPLFRIAKKNGTPILVRSINFEPIHFLEEDGFTPINVLKFIPKFLGELRMIRSADVIFSITPKERKLYQRFGGRNVYTLPLRSLPQYLNPDYSVEPSPKMNIFFMGSTYNVSHNRKAAEFVIKIASGFERKERDFQFHILGKKLPPQVYEKLPSNTQYEGYLEDLPNFIKKMDVALIPSLFGAGMQQKIFEPLAMGIPTITSKRGIAGYPFKSPTHLLFADSVEEAGKALILCKDSALRAKMSYEARGLARELFSEKELDSVVMKGIEIAQNK